MSFLVTLITVLLLFFHLAALKKKRQSTDDSEKLNLALSILPIIGLGFISVLTLSVVIDLVLPQTDELMQTLLLSEMSVIILLVLIYRTVRRQKGLRFSEVLGLELNGLSAFKLWIFPAVFAFVYAVVSSFILDARPIQPITPLQELLNSTTSLGVLMFFVATAVLTAPFFEEVIFRGFIFYAIRSLKGVIFAVIFVALIFGVMHVDQYWGDWAAIVVVAFFGLTLTLFRAWTGSSVPGMIAHYVYNGSLIIVPVIMVFVANPMYFDYQANYYRLNNEEKEERLLACIIHNSKFADPYNDLAWLYSEQGIKLERALELINEALKIEPQNYAFLDTKAQVLFKMHRTGEAVKIAEDLTKKYPNDVYLQEQLKKFHSEILK